VTWNVYETWNDDVTWNDCGNGYESDYESDSWNGGGSWSDGGTVTFWACWINTGQDKIGDSRHVLGGFMTKNTGNREHRLKESKSVL
jgi:hypothetical protein